MLLARCKLAGRVATLAVAAGLFATAVPAQQPQQAGVAAAVRGRVEIAMTVGAVGREIRSGEPIYLGNAVKSGPDSGLQILLLDQTTFTIGPNSELTIDQFVYDPSAGTGKVAASVAKGVFRFVTGKVAQQNPSDMTVRLPTGNIGIRGTIAIGAVDPGTNGQPLKQEVVLIGPGRGREGSNRIGALVLAGAAGSGSVTINQPGFGSQFGPGGAWGTPVRYSLEMLNAIQARIDTPIAGRGPGAPQGAGPPQGVPPNGQGGPGGPGQGGPPGAGPLGPLGPLGLPPNVLTPPPQCQQSSASSCPNLNPMNGMVPNGTTTFDQLRSISSGTFFYSSTGVPLSGGGSYNFFLDINFGSRTVGGGNSRVDVNGLNVSGSIGLTTQSFAGSSGNAAFSYPALPGLTGALCSPSCNTDVNVTSMQNSGGVAGATANHSIFVNGMGPSTQGSGTATRQSGSTPLPP